jgi:hypothetical protein
MNIHIYYMCYIYIYIVRGERIEKTRIEARFFQI